MVPPCTVPIKLKIIGLDDDIKGGAPLLRMFASFSVWLTFGAKVSDRPLDVRATVRRFCCTDVRKFSVRPSLLSLPFAATAEHGRADARHFQHNTCPSTCCRLCWFWLRRCCRCRWCRSLISTKTHVGVWGHAPSYQEWVHIVSARVLMWKWRWVKGRTSIANAESAGSTFSSDFTRCGGKIPNRNQTYQTITEFGSRIPYWKSKRGQHWAAVASAAQRCPLIHFLWVILLPNPVLIFQDSKS